MIDFLNDLNEPQRQAVENTEGPVMVIAGAGSGKTRVLTYRIAYLLSKGVDPFNILALTFTNKAAREMKERIAQLVGASKAKSLWMGTFHSIFAKILRIESEKLGFPSNFTIYDTDDSKRLLKTIVKEQQLDDKVYNASYVLHRISNAKNNLISAMDYNEDAEIQTYDIQNRKPKIGLIYSLYQQRLRKAAAMDFDDLLFNTNILLRDFPEVLYKYQLKFNYILVDEYQDTNFSQYLIVKKLAANNENICVVGDDAQSIYAFRGANIQNILNFKKDYPDNRVFKLEQNYRSTQNIVNAANSVIANNKDQIKKVVWTQNDAGEKIRIMKATSESEEGVLVANYIFETKMNKQLANKDFAILYRTNAQSRALEEALRKINIPYRIYGGTSFYQRKEIKDMLAYFRLVINPSDEDAFMRIVNFPARGIGKTSLEKLVVTANDNQKPLMEVAANPDTFQLGVNAGVKKRLQEFVTMIKSFSAQLNQYNAFEMGKKIASSAGVFKHYHEDESPEGMNRKENIEELLNALKDFSEMPADVEGEDQIKTLDVFMQDIALMTDADTQKEDPTDTDKVTLMTIHAAKGLEFPFIFLVGVEENLFPSQLSLNTRSELEEERRLFYVAVTRAMQQLTISYAETRFRFGQFTICEPSRFIDELNPECIINYASPSGFKKQTWTGESFSQSRQKFSGHSDTPDVSETATGQPEDQSDSLFQSIPASELKPGLNVQHQRFGMGKIEAVEGNGENAKATVIFNNFGKKQLLLKFAKLKILN
ncbi:MAG: UvrD-helicase domain-containing protein [Bacteroidales bacterium]|nr:UvrD-helicase domain-containing protein [Bacteroidales bacterium]